MKIRVLLTLTLCFVAEFCLAQLTGCYSNPTSGGSGRFYYVNTSGSNFAPSPYATSGSPASCTRFTTISVSSTPCTINGDVNTAYRLATANVPITCIPLDDCLLYLLFAGCTLGIFILRRETIQVIV